MAEPEVRYSWNQPVCEDCWAERFGPRIAVRATDHDPERCSYCGNTTTSGIFRRDDPAMVPYPAVKTDG